MDATKVNRTWIRHSRNPLAGWILDQCGNGKPLAGARVYSEQNYQTGLGVMLGYAIVGLPGALFTRETNCCYITISVQK